MQTYWLLDSERKSKDKMDANKEKQWFETNQKLKTNAKSYSVIEMNKKGLCYEYYSHNSHNCHIVMHKLESMQYVF